MVFRISELSKTALTPLYCALVRPHLEYAMEVNAPKPRADINQMERVSRLATRLARGLCHVPYEERLRQLNLFSLERRRIGTDLILAFKGEVDLNLSDFLIRGHTYLLLQGPSHLRRRSGAFSVRVLKYWNRLPVHLVLSPSVSSKNGCTVNGPKSSLCNLCPHSLAIFPILLPQTLVFPNPQSRISLCGYY